MARWWMGVALIAAGGGVAGQARGQYLPASGTRPPAAEPLPCAPSHPGAPAPGPGPAGPPCPPGGPHSLQDVFTLSANDPNAFGGPVCEPGCGPGAYLS